MWYNDSIGRYYCHMRIINDKRAKEKNNPFSQKEFFHV